MSDTLTLLGSLSATAASDDGTRHLGRGKPVALLAYLSAAPGRRASRERLATLLWSEGTSEQARQNLRQTIWYIRRRLGPWLTTSDDFLELVPEVDSDRERFLAAVRDQRLKDAVAEYTGALIPDFAAPGAAEFEEWADVERRRLRAVFVGCCDTLARQALGAGQFATAVEIARRARDESPLELSPWRLLLECLVAARDQVACIAEAQHLEALLAGDDLEPDDATRAALRAARAMVQQAQQAGAGGGANGGGNGGAGGGVDGADDASTLAPELIGRESEFRALLARWDAAREGRGSAVLITGVAGLGKSRLLADLHARLRASRAKALMIRANPGDRAVASGFLAAVAETVGQRPGALAISSQSASVLVALAPALASTFSQAAPDNSTGEDAVRRRVGALLDLLRAVSEESALALLIDDIHWTDPESRRVLDAVTARLDGGRILVVLATRPPLDALGGFAALPRIELPRFDLPRTAEFVTRLGELPTAAWAGEFPSQLLAATRGIPLTLIEALQRLLEEKAITLREHRWESEAPARVAELLREGMVLEARVRSLAPGARELLVLLATLGRPVRAEALAADEATLGAGAVTTMLAELEHRGFISRHAPSVWQVRSGGVGDGLAEGIEVSVAHDEIAAAALASATASERLYAHAVAARILAAEPENDAVMTLAAQHAVAADDRAALRALARRWVRRRRREGDGAAGDELVSDLLGRDAPSETRQALVRTLPWGERLSRGARRAVVLAASMAVLLGGWRLVVPTVLPEVELVFETNEPQPRLVRFAVRSAAGWSAGTPIEGKVVGPAAVPFVVNRDARRTGIALPDGSGTYGFEYVGAEYGDEFWYAAQGGVPQRPFPYRGDDGPGTASPDGRYLILVTSRWHPVTDRAALGLWDRNTGQFTRLVTGDEYDVAPVWSPDGSRIAFVRRYFTQSLLATLCVMDADGSNLRCEWPELAASVAAVAWMDAEHLLVVGNDGAGYVVTERTGETKPSRRLGNGVSVLGDSRTIICVCDTGGENGERWQLVRPDLPGSPRPLMLGGQPITGRLVYSAIRTAPPYVDRVALDSPAGGVTVDAPHTLRAQAWDRDGRRVPAHAVRFRSLDDSIATVDARGVLRPRAEGVVRIVTSVGGWRVDTSALVIRASSERAELTERWDAAWTSRWKPYGEPRPRLGSGDGGRTVLPNGDGKYASGLYLARELDPAGGLGVEFRFRMPVTNYQWQSLAVRFQEGITLQTFARWDHVTGAGPLVELPGCGVHFGGDGGESFTEFHLVSGRRNHVRAPAPADLYDGTWHTLRLQWFPDGRCAVALNGVPVAAFEAGRAVAGPALLDMHGHSVGTEIMVGRLELWSGVRGGIEWELAAIR